MFPIEVDLSQGTFTYDTSNQFNDEDVDDDTGPSYTTEYTDNPGGGNTGRYTDSVVETAEEVNTSLILTDQDKWKTGVDNKLLVE